jgi:biopolymer transport protein ExbD
MGSIFVVIVVLLLKSFSTGLSSITPSQQMTLPEVEKADDVADALKVEISERAILVGDRRVMSLDQFTPAQARLDAEGGYEELTEALKSEKSKGDVFVERPKLVVLADEKAPYEIMKRVFASTAESGFTSVKLLVVTRE